MAPEPAKRRLLFSHWAAWISTWFGVGLLPVAPGTWGSLAALPFAWALLELGGRAALLAAAAALFFVGWKAANLYEARTGETDPGPVVVDEVVGQWLTLVAASPDHWWTFAAGFALFRLFDIVKPWPVGWFDRRIKGGLGIMLDDVFAALYALLGLLAVYALGTGTRL